MKIDLRQLEGNVIFVGIDVHKRNYAVVAVADGMRPIKFGNLPADPAHLIAFLRRKFPEAKLKTAYEAGFSGFVLHRALAAAGIENLVVNPASIEVAANDKVKTDRRDAAKIADELMRGKLVSVRIPTLEEEHARLLTRTRAQLMAKKTSLGNQIKARLVQFGLLKHDDERVMSLKLLREIADLELAFELKFAIDCLGVLYCEVHRQIKRLEGEIAVQAQRDAEREALYRSLPGFGPLTARTVANELGDMSQFPNERAVAAFVGFTPKENSSGTDKWGRERKRRGHITRQGRSLLRYFLVEAAWRAIEEDPSLKKVYDRIKMSAGGKRAIVAVARRLLIRARACLQRKEPYKMAA